MMTAVPARTVRLLVAVCSCVCALLVVAGPPSAAAAVASPQSGVYTDPGPKAITGAAAFAAFSGAPVTRVLDFLNHTSWLEMTRNAWLLSPYTGSGYQLQLSVPMLPDTAGVSLARCAAGEYDVHWRSIATSLVAARQLTADIRPGWEFNGAWYKWSAVGKVTDYKGCFQRVVTVMRSVPETRFSYTWNPNLGAGSFPAEQAYPGDTFVDTVAVDVYDTSWTWYPTPSGVTREQAQTNAWNWIKRGDHGLDFWTAFAAAHGKPLGIAEWGVTWRSDGRGGGDDPAFVDRMIDFIRDPANRVSYANYFNSGDSASVRHNLTRADTTFPVSAARFQARMSTGPATARTARTRTR